MYYKKEGIEKKASFKEKIKKAINNPSCGLLMKNDALFKYAFRSESKHPNHSVEIQEFFW